MHLFVLGLLGLALGLYPFSLALQLLLPPSLRFDPARLTQCRCYLARKHTCQSVSQSVYYRKLFPPKHYSTLTFPINQLKVI